MLSVRAGAVTTIGDDVKIGAQVHIATDVPPASLVYIDRETGKTTIREGYYREEWKIKNS